MDRLRCARALMGLLFLLPIAPAARADDAPAAGGAAGDRPFCASRPGMGTPACVVAPGRVMVEAGALDWTGDGSGGGRDDSLAFGEALVRIGVGPRWEAQVGWDGIVHRRVRDPGGAVAVMTGAGDALVGIKYSLIDPDGQATTLALLPFATLPVGAAGIGAGDWGAGLTVPFGVALPGGWGLAFTPQVLAAVNASGRGRHLGYGGVAGVSRQVSRTVSVTGEIAWARDDDPDGASAGTRGGLSLAWMVTPRVQLDTGANLRIGGSVADSQVYVGVSRRF